MESKQLKALVERRHPMYESMESHWDFMEASYVGGREWFTESNIFQYLKEGSGEFKMRLERAYRFNHTREVVDLVNKYLFRTSIDRVSDDAPESVKDFWARATTNGRSIGEFMRVGSTKSSVFGCPWIIVDNDMGDLEEGATQAEVKEAGGLGIYAYMVSPQNVLDMSYDDTGILNWILVRESVREDDDPFEKDGGVEYRYRLWTRTNWYLIKKVGRRYEMKDGSHNLGEVPAVRLDNSFSSDLYSSPALIADIAYLDRACANYASNLDAIIQDQTFSQLAMPAQNVLPGDDAHKALIEAGTKRVFLYDGENGQAPTFLSPDPRQAQLIITAQQQLINEIYHSVGLAGERTKQDNSKGIDNSSGVAKSKDFERVVALLSAKADSLETAENKLVRLACLWAGDKPPEKDLVSYSREFDVRGLNDELDLMTKVSALEVPEKVLSQQLKNVVEKMFPDLGADILKAMKLEIDQWAKESKENLTPQAAGSTQKSKLLEEAARNRSAAGAKQSDTKSRETDSKPN